MKIKLPHEDRIEKTVLSALIDKPERVTEYPLTKDHFYITTNQNLYELLRKMDAEGENITPTNIFYEINDSRIEELVEELLSVSVLPSQFDDALERLEDMHTKRRLIISAHSILRESLKDVEVTDLCTYAETEILSATAKNIGGAGCYDMRALADEYADYQEIKASTDGITGIPTGFTKLDNLTAGLQDSTLTYVGGRPAMGKTTLGIQAALNAALKGYKVLFFSLEMDRKLLMEKIVSNVGNIAGKSLLHGLDMDDAKIWSKFMKAIADVGGLPITITDEPGLRVDEICSIARREKQRTDIDLIVIDYMQKIHATYRAGMSEDSVVKVISDGLANLARKLDIPILCMSQLNRQVEYRKDKRPTMADLRESGNLEQDGFAIWLMYRHEYYEPKDARAKGMEGKAELIIGKNRMGPTGTVMLDFEGGYSRFKDAMGYTS